IVLCLQSIAATVLGEEPVDAVITVPANFTNAQREATKDAGRIAGLNVMQIVNEPTAAAIAFSKLSNCDEEMWRVLVYDLGGGTFDVSLVEITHRETKVIATDGLTSLGGNDFDMRIYDEAVTRFRDKGIDTKGFDWVLLGDCENAKRALARSESAWISTLRNGGAGFNLTYTRFCELCSDLFERTLTLTDKMLREAAIDEKVLDEVMLVGGSTRIRRVREMIAERFPIAIIRDETEPELAVAKGAAILAEALSKQHNSSGVESSTEDTVSLLDVTPLSIGLRVEREGCKVLIPRNTRCPFATYEYCTNMLDNRDKLIVEILEGDYVNLSNINTLAKLDISIPPRPRGKNKIKVELNIDVNGILNITATDDDTKVEVKTTIQNEKLNELEIVKMAEEL
ncbi:hypothetical protein PMAYCL1PPCAC_01851, partial [Pristionchus mayeri]